MWYKILKMKFPLKLALSAVLAKSIAAGVTNLAKAQQLPEMGIKYQQPSQQYQPAPAYIAMPKDVSSMNILKKSFVFV